MASRDLAVTVNVADYYDVRAALVAAELRGYRRAIDALREHAEHIPDWYGDPRWSAADYLESLAPKEHGS